ncbi:hypothetical protein OH799_01740 [Nocardia sp. NBC_00881]|uniref:hypothetical protein n=1 Tax=Nocardia sp. NBC_00881 TaxID=2975995 RepID=UPI00386F3B95|nr:hypothetical protein OH799_01740 [Nocardia sp. NBC_00881]
MMTTRNCQRSARTAAVFVTMGAALVLAAAPALADNAVDIAGVEPGNVGVNYSCDASAGATRLQAMAGEPTAEQPAAAGNQNDLICDGTQHVATVPLAGANGEAPLQSGKVVQVRVALTGQDDVVISGQTKVLTLG